MVTSAQNEIYADAPRGGEGSAYYLDHRRAGCDGDSVSVTGASEPSIEDLVMGAFPGLPKVYLHNPGAGLRGGRRIHELPLPGLRRRLDPFVLVVEGSIPNERSSRKATGPRWAPIARPASRFPPANGSTGSRRGHGPSWPAEPAQPTAASTPWRAIRPAAWAWPITWAGTSAPRPGCPSSTCRAARCSPTTTSTDLPCLPTTWLATERPALPKL